MSVSPLTKHQAQAAKPFDVAAVRAEFPILAQTINGKPLVYLDNAATAQKPRAVIDCERDYYTSMNANVHRGVHTLSERATTAYERARETVRTFINAARSSEIVFTRGTTEAINLVAHSLGSESLKAGDEILITGLEHHSNIVPWQLVRDRKGASLKVAPVRDDGSVDMDQFAALLTERTRIVAIVHMSNALGIINPVRDMVRLAHARGAHVLIDGAQAVVHGPIDVQDLDCDFYAFSGHKLYAPTGIGVLYGREALLDAMPPYQGGGEMIKIVRFDRTEYNDLPHKFEAGTPNIAGAIGLGKAIEFFRGLDLESLIRHEEALLSAATERLLGVPGLRVLGTAAPKSAVVSFVIEGTHPHDIGTLLDTMGIAVRTGHHCAMPVMERFGVAGTVRASFALYNTLEEVAVLAKAVHQTRDMLR
jgi:cysteine desulfurase/selenocysteine lyase